MEDKSKKRTWIAIQPENAIPPGSNVNADSVLLTWTSRFSILYRSAVCWIRWQMRQSFSEVYKPEESSLWPGDNMSRQLLQHRIGTICSDSVRAFSSNLPLVSGVNGLSKLCSQSLDYHQIRIRTCHTDSTTQVHLQTISKKRHNVSDYHTHATPQIHLLATPKKAIRSAVVSPT